MWLSVYSLWRREIVRFLRDRPRVSSSLGQPLLFWLLFSGALHDSFRPGDVAYARYFFAGTLAMVVLFTSIFSTITVIEDRREGFLQGVLVAPVPRAAIALGKVLGGATLGLLLGVVFLLLGAVAGVASASVAQLCAAVGVLALMAFALTCIGFALAWRMDSTAGYHGVMMVLLMPMLLLSGAFFPAQGAHWLVAFLMTVNPLTYALATLRYALGEGGQAIGLPPRAVSWLLTAAFCVLAFALAALAAARRSARDTP